jgi:flagellar basal-body rod protein FlgC
MTAFAAIDVARTGVGFSNYWIDQIAHNIANVNTTRSGDEEPFRSRMVIAQQLTDEIVPTGSGVGVGAVMEMDEEPARVFDPDHPLADDEGYIHPSLVDMAAQMSDLMLANRTYQANLRVIDGGREAYEAALRIGRG